MTSSGSSRDEPLSELENQTTTKTDSSNMGSDSSSSDTDTDKVGFVGNCWWNKILHHLGT